MLLVSLGHGLAQQTGGGGVPGSGSGGSTTPTGPAGGALSGTYPNPSINSSSFVVPSPTISQSIVQPAGTTLQMNNVLASPINNVIYADGVNGAGIGVASAAWSSATAYPLCSAVSFSGGNYLGVSASSNVTPGTNAAVWYAVPNSATPTQLDCAFYIAAAKVLNHAGASLRIGVGTYPSGIGLVEPIVSRPGDPVVNIYGQGRGLTMVLLNQNNGDGFPFLYLPPTSTPYAFASFDWQDFTIDANFDANGVIGVYGAQQFVMKNILALNATDFSDHYIEFGNAADTPHGWVFEPDIENVDLGSYHGSGNGALVTTTVSGGAPSFTVTAGGSGYNATGSDTQAYLIGTSNFGRPCSSMGTTTATVSGGVVTAVSSTASGCVAPLYTVIVGNQNINYGYKFSNASDSKLISSMTDGGIGSIAGMYLSPITSQMSVYKYHPEDTVRGVQNFGANTFISLQCDTIIQYCFDSEATGGTTSVISPVFEWNNSNMTGSRDYYFSALNGTPNLNTPAAFNIYGEQCGDSAAQTGYAHFDSSAGVIDSNVGSDSAFLPAYVHDTSPVYCNQLGAASTVSVPTLVGNTISFSNGVVGNGWNFNLGNNFINGATQTLTLTQGGAFSGPNVGSYIWDFSNLTAATSGQNYVSPTMGLLGTYWNGSASAALGVNQQLTFAAGANPAATYLFQHSGTVPTGGMTYSFDNPVTLPNVSDSGLTAGNCVQAGSGGLLTTTGSACGSGSGGAGFSAITSGTNTTAAMVVGAGATLNFASSGTINASTLGGTTFAAPGAIGATTPGTGAFTSLSASGGLTATSDGVHAGYDSLVGNTTNPTIVANTAGELGPNVVSFTAYALQRPSAGPAVASVLCLAAVAGSVSAESFCGVTGSGGTVVESVSPAFTGTPTAPTQATADASTDLATDAFVHAVSPLTQTANATGFSVAGGTTSKTLTVNNTLTLAGTDATTMTFPAASTTVAGVGTAQTFSAANTFSAAGAASTPGLTISGAPYTAGTATTDFPQLYLNAGAAVTTLSTAGTEFGINAPSGFSGHFLNFFVNGGSTRFRVDSAGDLFAAGTTTLSSTLGLSSVTAPTIANGAGAGTTPGTPTVTGNNNAGVITVITGTATPTASTLATVTFNGTLGTTPNGCSLMPRTSTAAGAAATIYTTAPSTTAFTLAVGTAALTASTTYSWSYLCL